jgi:pyridoxamine 5'-phosphate oxidase
VVTWENSLEPLELVATWLEEARAAGQDMPEAVTLATVTPDGWPSARMVILRGIDHGLVFYTDCDSDKGRQLTATPRAAVVLHWLLPSHRQIRVVGGVEKVSAELADEYWRTRRPEARRSAAASHQSHVIASREALRDRLHEYEMRFPDGVELPRPSRWGGFRLIPATVEFWQEAPDGMHDRLRYRRAGRGWSWERLSP